MPSLVEWRLVVALFGIGWVFAFLLGGAILHAVTIRGQLLLADALLRQQEKQFEQLREWVVLLRRPPAAFHPDCPQCKELADA